VFEYSWSSKSIDESSNKLVNDVKVTFDTPGSAVDRRSSVEFKFDDLFTYVALGLEIPVNKVSIHASMYMFLHMYTCQYMFLHM
jgi:hypothetical protein